MTHDLTKITTPFGLLDTETQKALMEAHRNGKAAQIYTQDGWEDMPAAFSFISVVWRIKPEPEVVSLWASVYTQYLGLFENSRQAVDVAACNGRVCVLRVDWCDGDISFHKEEI